MNFRRHPYNDEPEINLIPLIDVLLVILIFLAATTSFTRYQQLRLDLPQARGDAPQRHTLDLAISQEGMYALDGQLLDGASIQAMAEALRTARQAHGLDVLVIEADGQAPHASVIRAMEAARMAGIGRVNFATRSPE